MDISPLIEKIYKTVESHRLEKDGEYARWIWNDGENSRNLGKNEYGCADAVNILYTINRFFGNDERREAHITALQSMQDSKTGLFCEPTHHFIHTTAHCTAALELLDAKPLYPMTALSKYGDREGLYELLEGLDWKNNPWSQSHQGAGIYAARVLAGEATEQWQKDYFAWIFEQQDPETGLFRKGYTKGYAPAYQNMAGTFHYLFNMEYAKQPIRYPDKMIDTCIDMYRKKEIRDVFGNEVNFLEIDWVYCMNRASRQTAHRFSEVKECLAEFGDYYIGNLMAIDEKTHDGFNDLHMLFGAVCALAELCQALPGRYETKKPLRLVLDRRPFI